MSTLEEVRSTSKLAGLGYHDSTSPDVERQSALTNNQIAVKEGTVVNYVVSKDGYISESGSIEADDFIIDKTVVLSKLVTVTINPSPSDADVTLICPGYTQVNNSITVKENSTVRYLVAKYGYDTIDVTINPTQDMTINVSLSGHVTIEDFDYMVVRYIWTSGNDLDTHSFFTNLTAIPTLNNVSVGYGTGTASAPTGATVASSILYWAGDNTGAASAANPQEENILISVKNLLTDTYMASLPDLINIDLEATWYSQYGTPPMTCEIVAYKGGTMSYTDKKFVNTGGTRVQFKDNQGVTHESMTIDVYNVPITLRTYAKIGYVSIDKNTKSAELQILE